MGLGHFLESAGKAVGNAAKTAGWAVEHPDKVVKGAAMVGKFAIEHPGAVGKIAVKSLTEEVTNPVNLAVNAALLVGTLGAGTAAKAGAKVAAETAGKVAGEVATKAVGETAVKAGAETAGKAVAETSGKALSRMDAFLSPGKLERTLNPIETSSTWRTRLASGIVPEGAGPVRQAAGAVVQGLGRNAPTQLPGMSDKAFKVQQTLWRANRLEHKRETIGNVGKVTEAAAHPVDTAMKLGAKTGGESSEQTQVSQPGTGLQPLSQPVNSYSPGRGFGGQPPTQPPSGGTSSGAYGGMAGSSNGSSSATSDSGQRSMSATDRARSWMSKPMVVKPKGDHAWQGPNREAFGGISPNYDWRSGYQLRPVKPYKPKIGSYGGSEEVEQAGAYDVKSGQQPLGALNPGAPKMTALGPSTMPQLGPGPRVHFGEPGARPMGPVGGRKASFYAGSGVIDADSSSPDDYKFEPGGQGFLDFPDIAAKPLVQPKRGRAVLGV